MTGEQYAISDGGHMLARLSNEMVGIMKEYYGRGPVQAKSYMLDDFLLVVMRGGLLKAEETMLGFGHSDLVRQFRQTFQNAMGDKLVDIVEGIAGRKVVTYQSQVMFDPTVIVELFFFDRPAAEHAVHDTAVGQVTDESVGEVRTDAAAS